MKNNVKLVIIAVGLSVLSTSLLVHFFMNKEPDVLIREIAVPTYVNNLDYAENPAQAKGWSTTAPLNFTGAASLATKSVVSIRAHEGDEFSLFSRERFEQSSGSGVLISEAGYIVTNRHVIENMSHIEVTLYDKTIYPAILVGIDASTDLAVLKIDGRDLDYLDFANSDATQIGEWVLAVGNPFSLSSTVTAGIVSAKGRSINILDEATSIESFIQTDAAVNPGNSGGALVNTRGELVGINTAILTKSGRYEGYSFAVPSNIVRKISSDIIEFGAVQRAMLGVNIQEMTLKQAMRMGLEHTQGILITAVETGSAAETAGLRAGDLLLKVDGSAVNEISLLKEKLALKRPGDQVNVQFRRNEKILELDVALKNVQNTFDLIRAPRNALLREIGFDLRDLSAYELELFDTKGAFVSRVDPSGLAAESNLSVGFIVEFCNDVRVLNSNQLIQMLEAIEGEIYLEGRYNDSEEQFVYVLRRRSRGF